MGLQDAFFALGLPFDSPEALELSTLVQGDIELTALEVSADLAGEHGAHPSCDATRAARVGSRPTSGMPRRPRPSGGPRCARRWRARGLRNSLLLAIAPTATIASIAGCYECIELQVSNLFKREMLSGEFLQVNTALVLSSRRVACGPRRSVSRSSGPRRPSRIFRDESMHMAFAFDVVDTARAEDPELWDAEMEAKVREMLMEGVDAEAQFAEDLLGKGVAGLSTGDMRAHLEFVADRRMERLGLPVIHGSANPLAFMELQDVQELSNSFERRVSAYQVGVTGSVDFDEDF
jgi:hypothetical protein